MAKLQQHKKREAQAAELKATAVHKQMKQLKQPQRLKQQHKTL
jgi:hypothetical protein